MCACACLLSTTSCVAVHFFFQICRQNTHFKYVKCRQRTSIVVHVMHEAIKYLFAKVMNVNNHTRYDHIQEIERHSKTDFLKITLKSFQTKNLVTVWLNKLHLFECLLFINSKCFVSHFAVGNKNDDPDQKVVITEDAQRFAKQMDIQLFETSAKDNINVEEMFYAITKRVLHHKLLSVEHEQKPNEKFRLNTTKRSKKRGCC